ncbi:MAG: Sapep family Mn(2+)-dependent dipeptidase [Spirochaetota bacterium]
MKDDIERWFLANLTRTAKDILGLVAIPSVSSDRAACAAALARFLELAREAGFETRLAAKGDVGVATLEPLGKDGAFDGGKVETLGILAHVDVVDSGDPSLWRRSPTGEIADGAVWGRGSQDDKGPLVVCLHAIKALRELGIPIRKRISFIVGTMEETGWADMRAFVAESGGIGLPDYGFTPDGEFPLTNREKGYCDAVLTFDRATAGDLGDFSIESLEGGVSPNAVPGSASAVLVTRGGSDHRGLLARELSALPEQDIANLGIAWRDDREVVISAKGRAAHSSTPEKGDNAILRLCTLLSRLGDNKLVSFVIEGFAGSHLGLGIGLQTRPEESGGEHIGPTLASVDLLSSDAGAFTLTVNTRTAYAQTEEEIGAAFRALETRFGYRTALAGFMPALLIPKDSPFMRSLMRAYVARTGRQGDFLLAPGTSYAKALPGIACFGPVLPGHRDLCHEPDERMTFDEMVKAGCVYADAISAIVSNSDSFRPGLSPTSTSPPA